MEALFHLIFELIKTSILGSIYATVTLLTFRIIGHYKPESFCDRISKRKLRFWFLSGFFISVGLFFFMFTYWGNHGLGDSARIPIGHSRAIQEVNGTQAYIQDEGPISMIEIEKFLITDNYVYGLMGEEVNGYKGKYFAYDLINNKIETFEQESDFTNFLIRINIDTKAELKDFGYHYDKYWHGWRFWLLL